MMGINKILPLVLIALVVVSAVQAFQLSSLKEKISEGKVSVSSAPKGPVAIASSGGAVASSGSGASPGVTGIESLPTMVGGC